MKNVSRFSLLALIAALPVAATSLAGCFSPAATNSVGTPTSTNSLAGNSAPVPTDPPAATPKPAVSKTGEDERYRATVADEKGFGPKATPEMIASYKAGMAKAHQMRPPLNMKVPDKVKVLMNTSKGPITLELDAKAAPLHVKSFVYLAKKGFFDDTTFPRHADLEGDGKSYIIQGGDPLTKNASTMNFAGMGGPGYEIPREHNKLTHQKLIIAAARTQDPNSAGSQFYITQGAVPRLDTGDGYTVFGKVVGGAAAAMKLTQGDILRSVKVETPVEIPSAQPKK